jgi:hypothetical protein
VDAYHFQQLEALHLHFSSETKRLRFKIPSTVTDLEVCALSPPALILPLRHLPPGLTRLWARGRLIEFGNSKFPRASKCS